MECISKTLLLIYHFYQFLKNTSLSILLFGKQVYTVLQNDNLFKTSNDFLQFFKITELKVKCWFKSHRDKSALPTAIP